MFLILDARYLIVDISAAARYVRHQTNGVTAACDRAQADAIYSEHTDTFYPATGENRHRLAEVAVIPQGVTAGSHYYYAGEYFPPGTDPFSVIRERVIAGQAASDAMEPITARQLRKALELRQQEFKTETDPAKLLAAADLYPDWAPGRHYEKDDLVNFDGGLYRVLQTHDSQAGWAPGTATQSLFTRVQVETPGVVLPWVVGEAVKVGDKRTYGGKTYECTMAHTTQANWTPTAFPAGWKEVK